MKKSLIHDKNSISNKWENEKYVYKHKQSKEHTHTNTHTHTHTHTHIYIYISIYIYIYIYNAYLLHGCIHGTAFEFVGIDR